ncbi:glycosyltransferase family 4 protein [Proteus sp. G2671]|uniref:Gt3 n=1 Tax=Proteus penneri TaxID=102862 RepID=A0A385JP14_9GAMM|nr:glycosyltransferase family 4 protein [Proteus sp. G2671]AXZ00062.1 gt3 [Proteus penneri]NBM01615.1 glycosyltransferase [Proteus sp. G2671]
MKNIYLLIDDLSNTGGTERVATIIANQLNKYDYNITIFSLSLIKKEIFFPLDKNISIRNSNDKTLKFLEIIKILRLSSKNKATVIIISMGKLSFISSILSILFKPYKLILSEHISFESYNLLKRFLKKQSYKIANKVILLTKNDKDIINIKNSAVIRNINPYYQHNIQKYNSRKNIAIAIGRFTYQKNFERLIKLWNEANITNWDLMIIGKGENEEKLKELSKNNTNIHIMPPNNRLDKIYNNAKLMLMTSRYEGLPMVLIEAQGFGLPIISFDCKTGPAEIIKNNESGYLIDYNNDKEFIKKLIYLCNNDNELSRMNINAVLNSYHFSPEKIITDWIKIIEE